MKIDINKKILDRDNPRSGVLVPFVDYLLKYYWDGNIPVNIYDICNKLKIKIIPSDQIEISENCILNDKIIYINEKYFSNKTEFDLELEIATQLGFILRNISTKNIDRNSELFINGVKQARHLLMPDDVLIKFLTQKTQNDNIYDIFRKIPKNEVNVQLEKIKRKYFCK